MLHFCLVNSWIITLLTGWQTNIHGMASYLCQLRGVTEQLPAPSPFPSHWEILSLMDIDFSFFTRNPPVCTLCSGLVTLGWKVCSISKWQLTVSSLCSVQYKIDCQLHIMGLHLNTNERGITFSSISMSVGGFKL